MHILTPRIVYLTAVLAFVAGCKPSLTEKNAEKLIPDGMSEAQVYEMLGTNYTRAVGPHGEKELLYFFKYYQPPKVVPKINTMIVVISNGVVINRQAETRP
jgi:hypothetical protein